MRKALIKIRSELNKIRIVKHADSVSLSSLYKRLIVAIKYSGYLFGSVIKHFFAGPHNMDLKEQCFFDPDLEGLEKYEDWLK